MTRHALRTLAAALILLGFLIGCAPPPATQAPTAGPSATPRRLPTLSPTPGLEIEFSELTIHADPIEPDLWQVIGLLRNDSSIWLADMTLQVTIEGSAGAAPATRLVSPLLARLGPSEETAFVAIFERDEEPSAARAELVGYTQSDFTRAQLDLQILETVSERGRTLVLGEVTNESRLSADIGGLSVLALDSTGVLVAAAPARIYPQSLPAAGSAPFLAELSGRLVEPEWIAAADAILADPPARLPVSIVNGPFLLSDSQGAPFLLGELRNDGGREAVLDLILAVRSPSSLLAVTQLRPPLPLQAGETLAFSAGEFYGLEQRILRALSREEELDIEVYLQAASTPPTERVALSIQVIGFETVGSSLFLQGTLEDAGDSALRWPTIFATLRSTSGELLAAGWITPVEQLESGEALAFVLPIRLPEGVDPAAAEFDLRGFALMVED